MCRLTKRVQVDKMFAPKQGPLGRNWLFSAIRKRGVSVQIAVLAILGIAGAFKAKKTNVYNNLKIAYFANFRHEPSPVPKSGLLEWV